MYNTERNKEKGLRGKVRSRKEEGILVPENHCILGHFIHINLFNSGDLVTRAHRTVQGHTAVWALAVPRLET